VKSKIRIFFLLNSLQGGGAERVISTIINQLDKDKFIPTLVLLQKRGKLLNHLDTQVRVIDLNSRRVRFAALKLISLFWRERPDIVFTGMLHLSLWTITFKFLMPSKIKFIARETTIISAHYFQKSSMIQNWLVKLGYSGFDRIICQSSYMKEDLTLNFRISPKKIEVINNPVDVDRILLSLAVKNHTKLNNRYEIITAGRLSNEKGYDILIRSVHYLIQNGEEVFLTIVGEGPLENDLKQMTAALGIDSNVKFEGFLMNPYPSIAASELFVLSSRYDGFPNAVIEAHICETPVVALNCPGGISEIILNGINGWLVGAHDFIALANAIKYTRQHPIDKHKIRESAIKRYDCKIIVPQYENLFYQVLKGGVESLNLKD
jgi:glycosyltransferase involved in cell wall biosynthesis